MNAARMRNTNSSEALLMELLHADSEAEVMTILRNDGYWDSDTSWRNYGDTDYNFSAGGNQQRTPEGALVEKIINSVDASLMLRCAERGIPLTSPAAPRSVREAVAVFFEGADPNQVRDYQGSLASWTRTQLGEVARQITVALTGPTPRSQKGAFPSITIADAGEGQAPERLPDTILSLHKSISPKRQIPFVQGKFNMGGTGALRFCGKNSLQLVVSKRNTQLAKSEGLSQSWGFTIVRREFPDDQRRISVYRYLAPVGADSHPNQGSVLTVDRKTLPIFPDVQDPYKRESEWGTLLKLYEYQTKNRTHFFMRDGLQERLDLLMPGLALPVRLYECRGFRGEERSFETNLTGLLTRLKDSDNVEEGFPSSGSITVDGEEIGVSIFAFKSGRAATYRNDEGVLFVINGQTHAALSARLFRRKSIRMDYIADSLLVILDCTQLRDKVKEELFMNSRDRLADSEIERKIENELEDLLSRHDALKLLNARRRQEEIASKLSDDRPMEDVLKEILRKSPTLSTLFLQGSRLSTPFAIVEVRSKGPYVGKPHPTFFNFLDMPYGKPLIRSAQLGHRVRLTFQTDVVNDYFSRNVDPGKLEVEGLIGRDSMKVDNSVNLYDGYAHLNVTLPEEVRPDDVLHLTIDLRDPTMTGSFRNEAAIRLLPERLLPEQPSRGTEGRRRSRKSEDPTGAPHMSPAGIRLPNPHEVTRAEWTTYDMDENSTVRIKASGDEGPSGPDYDFYVNVDNIFLQSELKHSPKEATLLKAKFKYGTALIGLAAIWHLRNATSKEADQEDNENREPEFVANVTDAVAPVIIPLIDQLSEIDSSSLGRESLGDVTETN